MPGQTARAAFSHATNEVLHQEVQDPSWFSPECAVSARLSTCVPLVAPRRPETGEDIFIVGAAVSEVAKAVPPRMPRA